MSKTSRLKAPQQPFIKLRRLLLSYELNAPRLAAVLGCSVPTARHRINDPGSLTMAELSKINRFGHVPIEEIRDAVLP